MHGQNHFKCRG